MPIGVNMSGVPICWGTQLNGNTTMTLSFGISRECCPYLLGNTVEWKLHDRESFKVLIYTVPICWGTQLNGNKKV